MVFGIKNGEYTRACRDAFLQHGLHIGDRAQRLINCQQGGDEAHKLTGGQIALHGLIAADKNNRANRNAAQSLNRRAGGGTGANGAHGKLQHAGNGRTGAVNLVVFLTIGFDDAQAAQCFGNQGRKLTGFL